MINKNKLLSLLSKVDKKLNESLILIAIGGTAMTMLNMKFATKDIDFLLSNSEDEKKFISIMNNLTDIKIDTYYDNMVFSTALPEDVFEKCISLSSLKNFLNIRLYSLNLIDLILTKTSRLSDEDLKDIEILLKKSKISKQSLLKRAELYEVAGSDEIFRDNVKYVAEQFY